MLDYTISGSNLGAGVGFLLKSGGPVVLENLRFTNFNAPTSGIIDVISQWNNALVSAIIRFVRFLCYKRDL